MNAHPGPRRAVTVCVAVVALALLVGLGAGLAGGGTAGDGVADDAGTADGGSALAADPSATDPSAADPSAAGSYGEDPLAGESGTVEVVVRFDPLADPESAGDPVDELKAHADAEQRAFESFAAEHDGVAVETEFWLANAMLVRVDADAFDEADLLAVANVTAVHENVRVETHGAAVAGSEEGGDEADPIPAQSATTYGLEMVGAPAVWSEHDTRGAGATVAVIDTGVDPTHQDIDLGAWAKFDENGSLVSDDVADAADLNGHGTHVAGTVAGGDASGTHIGVAPEAALYGIDTFEEDGSATFAGVVAGMEHATADEDVDVLQMSLGANGTFSGFIRPVRNARAADKLVLAAAGNEGHATSSSPANVYDALAVGGVRPDRGVAEFSGGESINRTAAFTASPDEWPDHYVVPDVVAPGVSIVSAEAGTTDGYLELQGTSMATPHVAGVAALAIAATDGRIGADDLHAILIDTAVHPAGATEPDDRHGHGVVDGEAAVDAAIAAAPAPPTETPTPPGTPTGTPEAVDPADSEDDAPGFGVLPALTALAVALAVLSTRRRGG